MLSWGIGLVIIGIIVIFVAFVFALVNMAKAVKGDRNFGSTFTSHLGAMIAMTVGGGMSAVGVILVIIVLFQKFVLKGA